jgi:predicted RNase H-related nuclease YkuK (DUF458 family)
MNSVFRTMHSHQPVDLLTYVQEMTARNNEIKVYVGTDSQNYQHNTVYVSTVVLRYENNGAHVIYQKEKVAKITDRWTRLWDELQRSIELAGYLRFEGGIEIDQIDLDFNSDPSYFSHKLLPAAVGYVQSMGYDAKSKPDLLMATWAANVLCH